jgi:hypothetical protein
MKSIISAIANLLLVLAILYLPFAFIQNIWNPLEWHIAIRALYFLCLVAIATIGYDQLKKR